MLLNLAGITNDSIVDGSGIRMTVFTQGCPHKCKGCQNPNTHSFEKGKKWEVEKIIKLASENPLLDGITISGGEPFVQAEACSKLAELAHKNNLNVWTYTGYTYDEIINSNNENFLNLLKNSDVIVDGKFEENKRSLELKFRGSKNQRIIDINKTIKNKKIVLWN